MKRDDSDFDSWLNRTYDDSIFLALKKLTGQKLDPATALQRLDPSSYEERRSEWFDKNVHDALGQGQFGEELVKSNRERFEHLSDLVRRRRAVPFVGAGLSIPCGFPGWSEFLRLLASTAHAKVAVDREIKRGKYEEAASLLIGKLGETHFEERYRAKFSGDGPPMGAVTLIPAISNGCVITTNFDRMIEAAFGPRLIEKYEGRESENFCRSLSRGEDTLLKIHGDVFRSSTRVLTRKEYDEAYGDGDMIESQLPLPRGLKRVFCNYSLLFVGCSLSSDRTHKLFEQIVTEEGAMYLPYHYAILEWNRQRGRERKLADRNIFPIWYPTGEHDAVFTLLSHLVEEFATNER